MNLDLTRREAKVIEVRKPDGTVIPVTECKRFTQYGVNENERLLYALKRDSDCYMLVDSETGHWVAHVWLDGNMEPIDWNNQLRVEIYWVSLSPGDKKMHRCLMVAVEWCWEQIKIHYAEPATPPELFATPNKYCVADLMDNELEEFCNHENHAIEIVTYPETGNKTVDIRCVECDEVIVALRAKASKID